MSRFLISSPTLVHFFSQFFRAAKLTFFSTNTLFFTSNKEFDWFSSVCPNIQVLLIHNAVQGLEAAHIARFSKLKILDLHKSQFNSLSYILSLVFLINREICEQIKSLKYLEVVYAVETKDTISEKYPFKVVTFDFWKIDSKDIAMETIKEITNPNASYKYIHCLF